MATSFTNAIAASVGTQQVEVYTATQKSVVIGGSITNKLSTTVPVSIILRRTAVDFYVQKDRRVESNEPFELMKGNKLILNPGDKLVVSAKVDNSVDVVFSILQGVT
jgi:hypothetical protein